MRLLKVLSETLDKNIQTKMILREYPESTIKKLVLKFSGSTEDTEDQIRQTISDFERFKSAFENEDKDIFKHSYEKIKDLIKDKQTKQESKKNLDSMVQDYIQKYKGADLQLVKSNIKKYYEIRTMLPKLKEYKKDVNDYIPSELNALTARFFEKFNNQGVNELVAAIAQKFHEEKPQEDVMAAILPRAKRFVKFFNMIPLNSKLCKFLNWQEFENLVDGYTPMDESEYSVPEIDLGDVDVAYEDDNVLIFAPDQKHKCINIRKKFAPDRRWCTSWEGSSNYYYNYRLDKNLTLYYVINKDLPSSDLNYASVILVDKYGGMRLADGSNSGRYSGSSEIPWKEILGKIPVLKGKEGYFVPKPYSNEEQEKLSKYKYYNLTTTDPIAELGSEDEVELWMELRGPDFSRMNNGAEIFANLPEELQKKYIGTGNSLNGQMVRSLSPSALTYYISKKKEKLLQKSLKDLDENDIEVILTKEMRPYLKSLREKFAKELTDSWDPSFVSISYPDDKSAKFARMFGLDTLFNTIPENTEFLQIENRSNTSVILTIPDELGRFQDLNTLICDNIIREVPESIGECRRLTFLNLTNNKELTTLPESLANCTCLDFVSVLGSSIDSESLPAKIKQYMDVSEDIWEVNFPAEMRGDC